jgi:hypothetical protein
MAKTTFNPCVCGHDYIEHDEVAEKAAIDALSADADDLRDPDEEPEPIGEE